MRSLQWIFLIFIFSQCQAQVKTPNGLVKEEAFDLELQGLLSQDAPIVSVETLSQTKQDFVILDARAKEEYDVSHIPGAIHIGYPKLNATVLDSIKSSQKIAVYCSVGYRSERATQQLLDLGFIDVSNVYGSIFEWVNQGNQVVDKNEQPTDQVHTYNRRWSRWVTNPAIEKTW